MGKHITITFIQLCIFDMANILFICFAFTNVSGLVIIGTYSKKIKLEKHTLFFILFMSKLYYFIIYLKIKSTHLPTINNWYSIV